MEELLSEYRGKDDDALQRSLRALSGQQCPKAEERIKAIKQVVAERAGLYEPEEAAAPIAPTSTQPIDEVVARKYLAKLNNARSRGIEFSLTLADVRAMQLKKTCYYTGMLLSDDCNPMDPQKRTLERLDSSKGYTKENTVACCFAANALKNVLFEDPASICRMSMAEFKRFSARIDKR